MGALISSSSIRDLDNGEVDRVRELTGHVFKKVITEDVPFRFQYHGKENWGVVPKGFLLDGCSGPYPGHERDCIIHDWLYANHGPNEQIRFTKQEADNYLNFIAQYSFDLSSLDDQAWEKSGKRGPFLFEDTPEGIKVWHLRE